MRAARFTLLYLALAGLLLSACEGSLPVVTTPDSGSAPTLLRVNLDPALDWLRPALNACAAQVGDLGVLLSQPGDAESPDFTLQLGAPQVVDGYMAQLGEDQLVVVMNPSRALLELTNDEINGLISGRYSSWSDLDMEFCVTCETPAQDVHPWVYPLEDRLQQHILAAFGMEGVASQAQIAPQPGAARQAVAIDPLAIAIIPSRWVDDSVKVVPLSGVELPELMRMPILTLASAEPTNSPREWLLCLQNVISPGGP